MKLFNSLATLVHDFMRANVVYDCVIINNLLRMEHVKTIKPASTFRGKKFVVRSVI